MSPAMIARLDVRLQFISRHSQPVSPRYNTLLGQAYIDGVEPDASLFAVELAIAAVVALPAVDAAVELAAALASETELAEIALEMDSAPYMLEQ
jgi:hypothetical protein